MTGARCWNLCGDCGGQTLTYSHASRAWDSAMCTPKGTRWRRDLTGEQKSYLRGKRYQQEKRQDGGHGDQKSGTETQYPKTHQRLAKEYGVAPSTIQADAQFADALDTLAALRADLREAVLTRQT